MVNNNHNRITLQNVARHISMNSSSFCTFFKREKGKSFISALNEYRINCSCLMLRETNMPVSEICFAVGFNDIPWFNRSFRKQIGVLPKDYRARMATN